MNPFVEIARWLISHGVALAFVLLILIGWWQRDLLFPDYARKGTAVPTAGNTVPESVRGRGDRVPDTGSSIGSRSGIAKQASGGGRPASGRTGQAARSSAEALLLSLIAYQCSFAG